MSQFHQAECFPPQLSYSMPLCNIPGKYTETVDFALQRKFRKLFWQTSQNAQTVFHMYSVFLLLAFMRMRSLSNKANDFGLQGVGFIWKSVPLRNIRLIKDVSWSTGAP